jgi:uncharacterized metal-binding protein YceD (DUF177 family)
VTDGRRQSGRAELSHRFAVAQLPDDGTAFRFAANAEERAALALRFGLIDLLSLDVEGRIAAFDHGRRARAEGTVRARVVQTCVVTLEPVPATIEEPFVRTYASVPPRPTGAPQETVVDLDAEDPPEPLVGGMVDIGEAIAETLGLALDPYPRAPEAELGDTGRTGDGDPEKPTKVAENKRESPFSALKGLIKKP